MIRSWAVLILLIGSAGPTFAAGFSFQWLGRLPGGTWSTASGISADGKVVVGGAESSNGREAFRWTAATGMVALGDLAGGDVYSEATAVSADGEVIVGLGRPGNGAQYEAFRWKADTGMVGLGGSPPSNSMAFGVSADGNVIVGWAASESQTQAFRWTAAGMVGLGDLPGGREFSIAWGVSADGSTIAGFGTTEAGEEGFRWTATDGMIGLGHRPGSAHGQAHALTPDGSVIVGDADGSEGFRWTGATGIVGLGKSPDGNAIATVKATSGDGRVIVGQLNLAGSSALIWTPESGALKLSDYLTANGIVGLEEYNLFEATGVSADGTTIVGYGFPSDGLGQPEAWIVTVPEPSTALLAFAGLACLAEFKLQKQRDT